MNNASKGRCVTITPSDKPAQISFRPRPAQRKFPRGEPTPVSVPLICERHDRRQSERDENQTQAGPAKSRGLPDNLGGRAPASRRREMNLASGHLTRLPAPCPVGIRQPLYWWKAW